MQGKWLRNPQGETSVAFVHGIFSSGDNCWRHENGTYWPELLKNEEDFKALGIYVFTYRTEIFSGTYQLGDAVDALREHMKLDGVLDSKRIIFVCHSMGGIVVRQYLVTRHADLAERNIHIGLFLVASPSLGSTYANWLKPLAKILGNTQADALRFSQNNAWLNDLDRNFLNLKEADRLKLTGKELIEDNFYIFKAFWRTQVVEPFSGARYFGEPYKVPHSDHASIAKPENKEAIQHRLLCQFIKDMLPAPDIVKDNPVPSKVAELGKSKTDKKVFISYSHKQSEWVWKNLAPCLKAGGAEVIIDREQAEAGKAVFAQMDAQQNKAEIDILVLSPDYIASDYCLHEMNRAIDRDPNFQNGSVVPVIKENCTLPDKIKSPNPLYVDLRDDGDSHQWNRLLNACDADLFTSVPDWLQARNQLVRYLQRGESVNLLVTGRPKWRELIFHVQQDYLPDLGLVDLQSGTTASRQGLVAEMLKAVGSTLSIPEEPKDLIALTQVFVKRQTPALIGFTHFDMVAHRKQYEIDFFAALRDLMTDKRKLILLIQSRTPFMALLPVNHPLSSITDLKIVELKGQL